MIMKSGQDLDLSLYETTDINLATVLLARGYALLALKPQQDHRYLFCFKKSPDLLKSEKAFWDGQVSIEPRGLFECQRALKARMHNLPSR